MIEGDGAPIWYELMTTDLTAAKAFYAAAIGWTIAPFDTAAADHYHVMTAPDGAGVGGMMTLPAGAPLAPGWYGYVGVADVDATAAQVTALGGAVLMPPSDIPGVGRFAFVADPQGIPFYVMRGDGPAGSAAFDPVAPGHVGWNELATSDHRAALGFYGALFGWRNDETMSMGPLGDYCFVEHGDTRIGAMTTAGDGFPTRWTYYFNVASIDAAKARIEAAGGAIVVGPHEVPTGQFIVMATDPQGAAFALVGGR